MRSNAVDALCRLSQGCRVVAADPELQPIGASILRFLSERDAVCPTELSIDDIITHLGADPCNECARSWTDGSLLILAGPRFGYNSTTPRPTLIRVSETGVCLTELGVEWARNLADHPPGG